VAGTAGARRSSDDLHRSARVLTTRSVTLLIRSVFVGVALVPDHDEVGVYPVSVADDFRVRLPVTAMGDHVDTEGIAPLATSSSCAFPSLRRRPSPVRCCSARVREKWSVSTT